MCSRDISDTDRLIIVDSVSNPSYKLSLYLPSEDVWISKVLLEKQKDTHMIHDLKTLEETLKAKKSDITSNVIVDVGANIGIFSYFLLDLVTS